MKHWHTLLLKRLLIVLSGLLISINCYANSGVCNANTGLVPGAEGLPMFGFCMKVETNGVPDDFEYQGQDTLTEILDAITDEKLQELFPGYNENESNVDGHLFWLGVPVSVMYRHPTDLNANQMAPNAVGTLTLSFLDENGNTVSHTFTGSSKEIQDDVENYFKSSGGKSFLGSLFSTTVATTPYDPVAGNPGSYMARLINNNFNLATMTTFGKNYDGLNLFGIQPSFSSYSAGNNDTTIKQTT